MPPGLQGRLAALQPSLKLPGCADRASGSKSLNICLNDVPLWLDLDHPVASMLLSDWAIVTSTMLLMKFWIIEHRFWRLFSRGEVTERLVILPKQGVDKGNQASDHMTKRFALALVGLRSLIIATKPGNQALVQLGPFRLATNRIPRHQIHHLLHLTRSS